MDVNPELAAAVTLFTNFVNGLDREARSLVFHDFDADGVSAGVVLFRALERAGFTNLDRIPPGRDRDAWSPSNRERIASRKPDSLFVLDLGSRDGILLDGAATCLIDHHRPDGTPPGATLISAYQWNPIPNTSLMVYDLAASIAGVDDLDWIAAVGVLSDLGDKAPFPLIAEVRKRYGLSPLREVTTLVNSARRSSEFRPETAARALLAHDSPASLLASTSDDVLQMRDAREEVKREMNEAKKAAPKFSGNVALIRIHSRCQIHPLVAQIWRTRLPRYSVIVANDDYVPDRVNFSMRTASGTNLLDLLRAIDIGEGEGSFGHGHDQATGGSLPVVRWNLLLDKLGFDPSLHG